MPGVEARPGHPGQQEAGFTFATRDLPDRRDRNGQQELLRRTFADVGWRTVELVDAVADGRDFALDTFDQIHAARWHDSRVVLLGDSAWCAIPLSGLGTALALLGAYVLAELLVAGDATETPIEDTLRRYEEVMRPRATAAQKLLPGRVRSFAPRTELGIRAAAGVYRLVQTRPALAMIGRLARASGHDPGLPDLNE